MVALGVDWTSFVVKYLVELVLWFVSLLTTRCAILGADSVIRLTLTRRIPLVAGPSTVIVALPVVEEEQERSRFPRRNNDNNGKRHNDRGGPSNQRDLTRKRKPDDTVGTMDRTPRGKKGNKPQDQFDKILHNKRCPIHPKSNHSMWECTILRKSFQSAPATTLKKEQDKYDEDNKKDRDGFQ